MKTLRIGLLSVALMLSLDAPALAQTGHDLFQQALVKEQADGDLRAAIALYQRIVQEFAADRALAARALVQMGQCHERLGSQDATSAYQRVLDEYSDQSEMAAEARVRLRALGASAGAPAPTDASGKGVVFKQIGFDGLETPIARFTPDGRTVVYVHMKESAPRFSIRARDLASGIERVVVDSIEEVSHFFQLSTDGSTVAYRHGRRELRTVSLAGGEERVVWSSPDAGISITPGGWAPDKQHLALFLHKDAERTTQLVVVPLAGGAPRPIVSGASSELTGFGEFSPSGNHIAGMKTVNGNTDVYVWSVPGGDETRITTHTGVDEVPYWSPDGAYLVFCSDRSGAYDLWAVPMNGSTPTGSPSRVRAGLGRRALVTGMMPTGALTIAMPSGGNPDDLYVIEVDPLSGEAREEFRPFARYSTQHSSLSWSPDGKRIAYTSRKEDNLPRVYVSSDLAPEETEVQARGYFLTNVEWTRDGERLLFPGVREEDGKAGVFSVSLADRSVEPLRLGERVGQGYTGAFVNLNWLPAAGRFFLQRLADPGRLESYLMDASGEALERVGGELLTSYWAWPSPNGRYMAHRDDLSLRLTSLDGGQSHLLFEWTDSLWFDVRPGWSATGDEVAWTDGTELAALNVESGTRRLLATVPGGAWIVSPPAWAPDGNQVAYVVRDTMSAAQASDEVWLAPSEGGTSRRIAVAPRAHPDSSSRLGAPTERWQ
ncbi:MAG: hypothetical protein ABIF09_18930 [Gemmatimonadota bacterium]